VNGCGIGMSASYYFTSSGFFLGLLTSTISSEMFQAAQPALLYLVPFTLGPLLVMAYLKVISIICRIRRKERTGHHSNEKTENWYCVVLYRQPICNINYSELLPQ